MAAQPESVETNPPRGWLNVSPDLRTVAACCSRGGRSAIIGSNMRYLVSAMLILVAVIHLLPLPGVLGGERLAALYGLPIEEPNLAILMRHRAVLFGLLGLFLILAAFRAELQTLALVAGFVSVVSFLLLAWTVGGYNAQIARVVVADIIALACLVVGAAAHFYLQNKSQPM